MSAVKTTLEARTLRPDLKLLSTLCFLEHFPFCENKQHLTSTGEGGMGGRVAVDRGQSFALQCKLLVIRRRDWGGESKNCFFGLPPLFLAASLLARRACS